MERSGTVILGVDVGGTSTDVVLLNETGVMCAVKKINTPDITSGVKHAICEVVEQCGNNISYDSISRVHIGTTHLVNGVVERKGLLPVAVIRIGGCKNRLATDNPPFVDFPLKLREAVYGGCFHVQGGYEFDGTEISTIDRDEIFAVVEMIKSCGVRNIVVSGIFSPANNKQEEDVLLLVKEVYPDASVTLSHSLGQLGLLSRENASILNETLKPLCAKTINGMRKALKELSLQCPMFLTQNDGTVGTVERSLEFPVMIMVSGPTNSMRGAAYLSGCKHALVADVGGTTTDVGLIENGFPRPSSATMKIGGVVTNFEIPDVLSEGLGGGSVVQCGAGCILPNGTLKEDETVTVGPESVGLHLKSKSIIYGGSVLTATDVAVAKGKCSYGKPELLSGIDHNVVDNAYAEMKMKMGDVIDRMKTGKEDVKLILVGGGSALFDEKDSFKGVSQMIKPDHYQVANAVGAALGQISGYVDKIVAMPERPVSMSEDEREVYESRRIDAINTAKQEAIDDAIFRGAKVDTIEIISLSEVPLSYIPGNATRIMVKAIGDLHFMNTAKEDDGVIVADRSSNAFQLDNPIPTITVPSYYFDTDIPAPAQALQKEINPRGEWILSPIDIECICIGAGILGCGGGGNPYLGKLGLLKSLQECSGPPKVVSPDAKLHPKGLVLACGIMGAPLVCVERFSQIELAIREGVYALHDLYNNRGYVGGNLDNVADVEVKFSKGVKYIDDYTLTDKGKSNMDEKSRVDSGSILFSCLMSYEIGGSNSTTALLPASKLQLPVIDADAMGRAFPELQMTTLNIYGASSAPHVLVSMSGKMHIILEAESMKQVEDHFRPVCVENGCLAVLVSPPITFDQVKSKTVVGTVTRVWELGRAVLGSPASGNTSLQSIINSTDAQILIEGKISAVDRVTVGGFNRGSFTITGWKTHEGSEVVVDFQNEFLIATRDGKVKATTPDLISLVDAESGFAISTDELRFGLRVVLLLIPAPPELLTSQALPVVSPRAFNYDTEYITTC